MSCYRPIRVAIKRKPVRVGGPRVSDEQKVPCGNCLGCRAEQGRQWAVRMMHEKASHDHAWFVTLTYDDEHLPEKGSLVPAHLKDFHDRLRRAYGSLSFYGCGEYGDQRSRPHYHTIVFGPDFLDRQRIGLRDGPPVWTSGIVDDCWRNRGLAEFGAVTMASASYVAAYARKKVVADENPNLYVRVDPDSGELVDVVPQFASMSRRPAIGKRWIAKHWREVYDWDRVVIDGVESKPPRYYDKWMETDHTKQKDCVCTDCDEHREKMLEVKFARWDPDYDDSAYKLDARRKIHEARIGLYQERTTF